MPNRLRSQRRLIRLEQAWNRNPGTHCRQLSPEIRCPERAYLVNCGKSAVGGPVAMAAGRPSLGREEASGAVPADRVDREETAAE